MRDTLAALDIPALDEEAMAAARSLHGRLTKPAGSLGTLEDLSVRLAGLARTCPPPLPTPAAVAIFAGDHGVHAQGVTPWPQEVTVQMVANFLAGGAVINAFARETGAGVHVVDVGIATTLDPAPGLISAKIRPGTADLATGPAMTEAEARAAIETGLRTATQLIDGGAKILVAGDMGIANTTPAAALIAALTGRDPASVTGRGTGIDDQTFERKIAVVRAALRRLSASTEAGVLRTEANAPHAGADVRPAVADGQPAVADVRPAVSDVRPTVADVLRVVAEVGGLEHAAIAGFILGAAAHRVPLVVDGVNAAAGALIAAALHPRVTGALIAGHRSVEPGATAALAHLGLEPLIDLGMRLGEGTGAVLALPIVSGAVRVLHEVATFDSAGVSEK